MNLLFESKVNIDKPFYSVCIETHNRGKTIYRALESLLKQGIDDFECIVADDCSSDNTISEIIRFTESDKYNFTPFHLKVYQNQKHLGGVLNWNSPLENARGIFIAGLEGDDYYLPEYLKNAYGILTANPNIGIYSAGSQRALRPVSGVIKSVDYFKYIYQLKNVSPPSEFIFKRLNKNQLPFKFNVTDYIYAPEIQLLLDVSADGLDAFHASNAAIYREPSTSFNNMSWKFFADKFLIIEKYLTNNLVSREEYLSSFRRQYIMAIRRFLVSSFQKKGNPESIKAGLTKVLNQSQNSTARLYLFLLNFILLLNNLKLFHIYFKTKELFFKRP